MSKWIMVVLVAVMALSVNAFAGGLNAEARLIKEKYPSLYENNIKKHALDKWGTNYEMVVYRINEQCESVFNIVRDFRSENTQILYDALMKWSYEGYEARNRTIWKETTGISVAVLLQFQSNFEMVEYQYDNQVEAKNSF